jgi:hypothetical protein
MLLFRSNSTEGRVQLVPITAAHADLALRSLRSLWHSSDPAARQATRGFHLQGRQLGAAALQLQRGQALQGPARLLIGSAASHVIINSCPCRCVAIKRWCISANVWEDWQASCGRGRNIHVSMISWVMYVGACLQILSVCMDWRNLQE